MDKIKILFKIGYIYHKAAMDPLIDIFAEDDKYDVSLSLTEESTKKFGLFNLSQNERFMDLIHDSRFRITDEEEKFDVVIVGDTIRDADKFGDTLLCFVNHGTGIKNVLYRNLRKHAGTQYMIFVEGDYRVEKLEESGTLGESKVFKVGLPKLDPYFREGYFDREKILLKSGLNPDKKTVLFAPTYKPTCIFDVKDHIFTETIDYNLIIKLHHYSWMGKYASPKQHKVFEERLPKFPHARLIPVEDYNIIPYMAVADTLISEASSTVFDFLAMKKIGIIYNLDHDKLKHSDGEHVLTENNREFLRDAFVHIDKPNQIHAAVESALNPTPEMVVKANEYRDYFFYKLDGWASIRLKEKVEELLSERGR